MVTPSLISNGFSRPLTQSEADQHGLGNAAGYRAFLDPAAPAPVLAILPQDPPIASNSSGVGGPPSTTGSWEMIDPAINYQGNIHLHPSQRQGGQPPRQGPTGPGQVATLQSMAAQQHHQQQDRPQHQEPDPLASYAIQFLKGIAAGRGIQMGQGGHQAQNTGGGGTPPKGTNLNVKVDNKLSANLLKVNKTKNIKFTGYPDLSEAELRALQLQQEQEDRQREGGERGRDVEGSEVSPQVAKMTLRPAPPSGAGVTNQPPKSDGLQQRSLTKRVTTRCYRCLKSAQSSLMAALLVTVILIISILVMREIGWIITHKKLPSIIELEDP